MLSQEVVLPNLSHELKIAVIGLGYVGLPLACALSKLYNVVGYDVNQRRVEALREGVDWNAQLSSAELIAHRLVFSNTSEIITGRDVYIITVPTPIDKDRKPNLEPLLSASTAVGARMKRGSVVIYESTVYPGCTEEECVPVLSESSGLKYNSEFFCGYSPERISPGDPTKTLTEIVKVTSGSTAEAARFIDDLYRSIIAAGTFRAESIQVAEAAKAIENAQRDLNISFVNEVSLICDRLNLDTTDVLSAAATKWNFIPFQPGLVGGHCIGVDPYYLTFKAQQAGYTPKVILSGREVNEFIPTFIAKKVMKMIRSRNPHLISAKILILGFAFKENCPDTRNTKVIDIYNTFVDQSFRVDVVDPWVNATEVFEQYGIPVLGDIPQQDYHAVILAVPHRQFHSIAFEEMKGDGTIICDVKSALPKSASDIRL